MESTGEIGPILDSCLTTATLEAVYPFEKQLEEILLSASVVKKRHQRLRVDLLEQVGNLVESRLNRRVNGEELFQVMRRVDSFLEGRNYLIKP
jgi:hypothetical protein